MLKHTLPVAILGKEAAINQDIKCFDSGDELLNRWFLFYLKARAKEILLQNREGTTVQSVKYETLLGAELPVPPAREQRRIIVKLEGLLSKVDACQKRLEKTSSILRRFRQSILSAACSGRLTEDWRAAHRNVEPGSELLKRIDSERVRVSGTRSKPLRPNQKTDGPVLPQSWFLTTPDRLAAPVRHALAIGPFGSNLKVSDYTTAGVPLVFVRHIRSGDFRGGNPKFVSTAKAKELAAHGIEPLDLLVTKMGEPPGDCEIYPADFPNAIITADCIKFRVWGKFVERLFIKYAINADVVKGQLGLITKGAAQQKISLERFKTILLPVPPLAEQKEIVLRVEALFKFADQIEARCATARGSVDQLAESILAKAFRGELVPQDPKDEPAVKFLERLRGKTPARALAATR